MAEIHEEMSELLDKQVNVQKESLKKTSGIHKSSRKPTKKVCDENERKKEEVVVLEEKKTTAASKNFLWKEGFYKAVSEDWLNRFRRTSGY